MYRLFVTAAPFLPFLGISVQTYCTFSMTIFICLSNALTFPKSFLLFLKAMRTSLLALTDLVRRENGPTLNVYYWGIRTTFYYSIFYDSLSNKINYKDVYIWKIRIQITIKCRKKQILFESLFYSRSSFLFDIHFHTFKTEVDTSIIGSLGGLFGFFEWFFFIILWEIFFFKRRKLIFFLFTLPNVFFGWIVSDKLVAIVLFRLKLKVFVALIHVLVIKFIIILFILKTILIIFNFDFNLITKYQVIIEIIQWIKVILLNDLSLRLDDLSHVFNHTFLNLKVNFQLNILKFKNMIFYDYFQSISILFWFYLFHNVITNLFSCSHWFHNLKIGDFFLQSIFVGWKF